MFDVTDKIRRLVTCDLPDPFEVLGPHKVLTSKGHRLSSGDPKPIDLPTRASFAAQVRRRSPNRHPAANWEQP